MAKHEITGARKGQGWYVEPVRGLKSTILLMTSHLSTASQTSRLSIEIKRKEGEINVRKTGSIGLESRPFGRWLARVQSGGQWGRQRNIPATGTA
ncbi:unnamed protein product [Dovyalis caffra]|uniref:Uncharacterized protein n=1 Tax=Dovyalis caffra TaxID=77055 RepID=A0AAV1SIG2_9ROSI|nr:unnamed protein product [Dovyalis caffra]